MRRKKLAYPFSKNLAIWNQTTRRSWSIEVCSVALLQLFWESAICKAGAFLYIMDGMFIITLICVAFFSFVCPTRTRCPLRFDVLTAMAMKSDGLRNVTWCSRHSDWLRPGRLRGRSSSPGKVKNLLHIVQIGSGVHPASYPIDTAGSFPVGKAARAWSWPLTSN
jgi:hypothetical protein